MKNYDLYYIDFDKLFENYADKYYREHSDEYDSPDDFARDISRVYDIWASTPQEVLGGIAPTAFFADIPDGELVEILKGSCAEDRDPSSLLLDRIESCPSTGDALIGLAKNSEDRKLLLITLGLLKNMGLATVELYIDIIERNVDADVKEECVEELCERAAEARSALLDRAERSDDIGMIELFVEPLTYCAPGDDRILKLLCTLLRSDPNIAYVAGLMGRYGDQRAAAELYPLLDSCDYAEFLEIRNAIEELGGTVDDKYRDFSGDPFYAAISNNGKRDSE